MMEYNEIKTKLRSIWTYLNGKISSNWELGIYHIIFSITDRCSSRCKTCDIWRKQPKRDFPVSYIKNVLDKFPSILWVVLSGGEPSLHPQLKEILSVVSTYPLLRISIVTNGLSVEKWEEILNYLLSIDFQGKKPPSLGISVSIDGPPKLYREIRGVDGFDKAVSTLLLIDQVAKEVNWIHASINYTVSKYNVGKLDDFLDFIKDHPQLNSFQDRINLVVQQFSEYYHCHERSYSRKFFASPALLKDLSVYEDEVLKKKMDKIRNSLFSRLGMESEYKFVRKFFLFQRNREFLCKYCGAARTELLVDSNGAIYPCSQWLMPIGKVSESGVVIDAKRREKVLQQIASGACGGCWAPCEVFSTWLRFFPMDFIIW